MTEKEIDIKKIEGHTLGLTSQLITLVNQGRWILLRIEELRDNKDDIENKLSKIISYVKELMRQTETIQSSYKYLVDKSKE